MGSVDVRVSLRTQDAAAWEQIAALAKRAESGDDTALPELNRAMANAPAIWRQLGDVAGHVERSWIVRITRDNLPMVSALSQQVAAMRQDLAGEDPSPLEVLLIARIVACWLQVQHADLEAAEFVQRGGSFREGDYLTKRQDRANKRYLASIKALAQIRRLQQPVVQVNIGEQQLNVAT